MAANVLAWLRKYCCCVENSESKTDAGQTEQIAPKGKEAKTREHHDFPHGELIHVKNESNTNANVSQDTQILPRNRRTYPIGKRDRSQSLRVKSRGVKLPGMGALRRRSLSIEETPTSGYANVNFTKRLIKRFNIHNNSNNDDKHCKPDDIDESETINADKTPPSGLDLYDDTALPEGKRNTSQRTTNNLESVYYRNLDNKDSFHAHEQNPSSDVVLALYDDTTLVEEPIPLAVTTEPHSSKTLSRVGSFTNKQYDYTEWEDNPAYNELQNSYVNNNPLTDEVTDIGIKWEENIAYELNPLVTDEKQFGIKMHEDETEWEENIAYELNPLVTDEKQFGIKMHEDETEWEENPAYYEARNPILHHTTTSVRSNNNVLCTSSSLRETSRSRAYTESMLMKRNFQRDLNMAINTRLHKTSLPLDEQQSDQ